MIEYDLARARQAVQFLVDSSYFHHHIKKLRTTVEKPRSMPFKDDAEVLNELLTIGRQNAAAMENLIGVAEFKRSSKNDYQRNYMAAKRQRDRKVYELEELMTGKALTQDARTKVLRRQYEVWNKEKDAYLKGLGEIAWTERNEATRKFWERKEHELDALITEAKANGPIKRKYRVAVPKEPKTEFGKALVSAVTQQPNKPVDKRR
jgi:hypothetical protein